MQFTAVFLKKYVMKEKMSLNDICCYIPAWFGVIASILVGLIAYECTLECNTKQSIVGVLADLIQSNVRGDRYRDDIGGGGKLYYPHYQQRKKMSKNRLSNKVNIVSSDDRDSTIGVDNTDENLFLNLSSPSTECAIVAMGLMAIVPAHLTRSVGGGFDNESIAISAMCLTFYFWIRSLRADDERSHLYGIATGIAYFYVSSLLVMDLVFSIIERILTYFNRKRW